MFCVHTDAIIVAKKWKGGEDIIPPTTDIHPD